MTRNRLMSLLAPAFLAVASVGCGAEKGPETRPSGDSGKPGKQGAVEAGAGTADVKITTVEAAREVLTGKWQINSAETKKLISDASKSMLAIAHADFTKNGGLEWPGMFDGGLNPAVTKFDLTAGSGDTAFVISTLYGVFPNGREWKDPSANIGVHFGSRDRLTLDLNENYAAGVYNLRKLVFDRLK